MFLTFLWSIFIGACVLALFKWSFSSLNLTSHEHKTCTNISKCPDTLSRITMVPNYLFCAMTKHRVLLAELLPIRFNIITTGYIFIYIYNLIKDNYIKQIYIMPRAARKNSLRLELGAFTCSDRRKVAFLNDSISLSRTVKSNVSPSVIAQRSIC